MKEFSLTSVQQDHIWHDFTLLVKEAFDNAQEHGFHDQYNDMFFRAEAAEAARRINLLAKLALIGSEVGEAVHAIQHGESGQFQEELADIVIRILDLCGSEEIDLGDVLLKKMMKNRSRPYMHGKKI